MSKHAHRVHIHDPSPRQRDLIQQVVQVGTAKDDLPPVPSPYPREERGGWPDYIDVQPPGVPLLSYQPTQPLGLPMAERTVGVGVDQARQTVERGVAVLAAQG